MGDSEQLNDLYNKIKELDNSKEPLLDNGFGKLWLGNLVYLLGGDWEKIYCRGSITDYRLDGDTLNVFTETACGELNEVRELLYEKYPAISIWYRTEEPGMQIFETNDEYGDIFPERWLLDYYPGNGDSVYEYFTDLKSLAEWLKDENIVSEDIEPTKEAIVRALENNMDNEDDGWVSLNEFEVVNY